jgi:hypothetical protein
VRLLLEPVVEGLQLRRVASLRVAECLRQQPVGEPRVAGKEGAVQIRADRSPDATALVAALAVVPEA